MAVGSNSCLMKIGCASILKNKLTLTSESIHSTKNNIKALSFYTHYNYFRTSNSFSKQSECFTKKEQKTATVIGYNKSNAFETSIIKKSIQVE